MERFHDCSKSYILNTIEKLFTCDGCKMEGLGPMYVCKFCDKTMHKYCRYPETSVACSEFFGSSTFVFTKHPSLNHDEKFLETPANRCTLCQLDIRGFSYYCKTRNSYLHPCCWHLDRKQVINGMTYDLSTARTSACNHCGKADVLLSEGWSYVSSCGNFRVHVLCMTEMLHSQKLDEDEPFQLPELNRLYEMKKSRTIHDCSKSYKLNSNEKLVFTCDGCKMEGFGPSYVCKLCDKTMHKYCLYPELSSTCSEFFGCSTFVFTKLPPLKQDENNLQTYANYCTVCQVHISGFSYYCQARNLYIHPSCWKLDRKRCIGGILYNLSTGRTSACNLCGNSDILLSEGWSYVSSCGKFQSHVYCMMKMVHPGTKSVKQQESKNFTLLYNLATSFWNKMKSFFRAVGTSLWSLGSGRTTKSRNSPKNAK